jgi:putative membrane protein
MKGMLWVRAFHVVFMVSWFAGLLYLPRLFVYHSISEDETSRKRFELMEKRLYYGIMYPAMVLTLATGVWMLIEYAWVVYQRQGWLHVKISLVLLLILYHFLCGRWIKDFRAGKNPHSHKFYRIINELPFVILAIICILVIVKPF